MSILQLALGVLILMGVGHERTSTVEGVFLGYDGGNQVGVYRLLVEGRIVHLNRSGTTTFDGSESGHRLQIGSILRVVTSPSDPDSAARAALTANSVKTLRAAGPEWEMANDQVRKLTHYLSHVRSDDESQRVELVSQLDSKSREALRVAHDAAVDRPVDPLILGIQAWTAVNSRPSRLFTIVNPVVFGGKLSLRVELQAMRSASRIIGLKVGNSDEYADLFQEKDRQ